MKSYETRHWTEVCSGSCPGCFFFSAKRAIGVHGRGGCDAPLTARLGAVGRRKILPKILKAKHDSVSKKTVTQWECHWLSYNNTYFITSQNFAICPKTFSDLLTVTINGMQEIHPVIHLLLKRSHKWLGAAVFFLFIFHCRYLHSYQYTYYSFPLAP